MKSLYRLSPYLKYLFIPGLVLAVAGGVAGSLTHTWTPISVGLLGAGVIILLLWLTYCGMTAQGFWSRRSTQAGTNALIATLSLLVILGLLNFLAARSPLRIDLTENQRFTLAAETKELVRALDRPMKLWIFAPELSSSDRKLLADYQRLNPKLSYELVDPQLKPNLTAQFQVKAPGEVYLEYGDKKQLVQVLNPLDPLSEAKLTNAIAKIQRNVELQVYFLQGHEEAGFKEGEGGLTQAIDQLQSKGFKVSPLNLVEQSTIPDNAAAIIVAGAKRPFFPQEVAALQAYSDRGGSLMILVDPNTDPQLTPLLKQWGVSLDPRVAIDASGSGEILGLGPATPVISRYGEHPITEPFGNGTSFFPLVRPVATTETPKVTAYSLITSNERMWAESDLNSPEIDFNPEQDLAPPFDLGVALTRQISSQRATAKPSPPSPSPEDSPSPTSDQESPVAKMVIFGNSGFITNGWFDKGLNGDLFLNSVQWLTTDGDRSLGIRPKEAKNRQIILGTVQTSLIAWGSLLVVPLLGLGLAAWTWWRRR
jgi:ABC-type uncharacterized transport system involved in gliding motility auxiliary subunit